MKILKNSKKNKILHFFKGSKYLETSFLKSYFQDKMGIAYVDSSLNPKSVQICVGDFSFYAGEPNIALVKNIKLAVQNRGLVVIDPDDKWRDLFEQHYGIENINSHFRQSFLRKNIIFDITKLKYYASTLPKDFYIKPIDELYYTLVLEKKWSEDFCINYDTYSNFEKNGLGFIVLHKDVTGNECIVSGASSYIYYEDGIEIQIATNEQYQNLGLATAVGATLILACTERNINPSWDSANKISSTLAQKFGYKPDDFYKAMIINLN